MNERQRKKARETDMFVTRKEMEDRFAAKKAEFAIEKDKLSLELKNSLSAMEAKLVTENDRLSRELKQSFEEERGNLGEQSQFYVKIFVYYSKIKCSHYMSKFYSVSHIEDS